LEVAYYLLNRNKRELAQIETDYDIEVTVKGKPSFMMNQMELDLFKKDKHAQQGLDHERVPEAGPLDANDFDKTPDSDESLSPPLPGEGEETKPKRKRRRGKKKPQPAADANAAVAEESAEPLETAETAEQEQPATAPDEALEPVSTDEQTESESPAEAVKKKRRRRRKRPAKPVAEGTPEEPATPEEAEQPVIAVLDGAAPTETPGVQEEAPKKKPRKPRAPRKPKAASAEVTDTDAAPSTAETTTSLPETLAVAIGNEPEPAKENSATETKTVVEEVQEKPKRKRAPRKKKEPVTEEPDQKE
jgi:ribonuclease E